MTEPFLVDADFTLYVGDVRDMLRGLASESVQMCVTSPPYWGLRDYGTGSWDGGDADCDHIEKSGGTKSSTLGEESWGNAVTEEGKVRSIVKSFVPYKEKCGKCGAVRVDKQLGLELTPEEYIANMVEVFHEVNRVLRKDGTLWLNIGDSYASNWGMGAKGRNSSWMSGKSGDLEGRGWGVETAIPPNSFSKTGPIKPKDLVGIPWMLAFALRADGWYLRSDVIWSKTNPMPESIRDRPTKSHEYLFLLAKSQSYYYDAEAIKEPATYYGPYGTPHGDMNSRKGEMAGRAGVKPDEIPPRNKRSVWEVTTEPYPDAHFATFPTKLIEPCILAGTSEKGCCPDCGAPWEREVERTEGKSYHDHRNDLVEGMSQAQPDRPMGNNFYSDYKPPKTLGWTPTCKHGSPPVPCTVMDPFMGSGTTAFVARKLGRHSIGIELNEKYALLSIKRLGQQSLFA